MHRDVNPMNIILFRKPRYNRAQTQNFLGAKVELPRRTGYLIDWDLACKDDEVAYDNTPYSVS